ncbi:DUF1934 domain-containing protein [Bacillus sp. T33-2]|uniref:DUF1934 domain-containing protein n=1 Tax=Bacillus sp. T33-2 TaxID=2054168 RepID=UPI000C769F37|nr:DUF1934 domain-containing protein [Bacillus sp. T33-2]PLR96589.1 DUF1934 domain-containing protein [Bacillus sp. T33-2]
MPNRTEEQIPVKIKVLTAIYNKNDKETFELTTFGRYYIKENSSFLQYEEAVEEGNVNTVIKISSRQVTILRKGPINMKLVFEQNQKQPGTYSTPYGALQTMTDSKRVDGSFNEETREGSIELLYDMDIQGSHAGTYHLTISFKEERK